MSTIRHPKEGLISIDYQLVRHDSNWRVQDILLDDVSLALNLQSQFNKVIVENSYTELLRRMREKLTE
jgi:ABC-type transporter MlaC component